MEGFLCLPLFSDYLLQTNLHFPEISLQQEIFLWLFICPYIRLYPLREQSVVTELNQVHIISLERENSALPTRQVSIMGTSRTTAKTVLSEVSLPAATVRNFIKKLRYQVMIIYRQPVV